MIFPDSLKPFVDADGRIVRLPAKHSRKLQLALAMLQRVEVEKVYSEPEINNLFSEFVDDFAYVRRTLVDLGYLSRDAYGKCYRRLDK